MQTLQSSCTHNAILKALHVYKEGYKHSHLMQPSFPSHSGPPPPEAVEEWRLPKGSERVNHVYIARYIGRVLMLCTWFTLSLPWEFSHSSTVGGRLQVYTEAGKKGHRNS